MTGVDTPIETAFGFAGLTALATKLQPDLQPQSDEQLSNETTVLPAPEVRLVDKPAFWNAGRCWGAAGITLFGLVGLLSLQNSNTSYRSPATPNTYAAPESYAPAPAYPAQLAYQPPQPSYNSPLQQNSYMESIPAVGSNLVLARNEILYCLSERTRLQAMGVYVDGSNNIYISHYNTLVGDYNDRCSNYRYRQSDMDEAKAFVDGSTDRLKAEAATVVREWR